MKYFVLWPVMMLVVSIFVGSLDWWPTWTVAKRGRLTQGEVIDLFEKNHQNVKYKYQVDGQNFEGKMVSRAPNPSFQNISIGQSVVVYYDRLNPNNSFLGDPNLSLANEIISVLLAVIFIPSIVIARIIWVIRVRFHISTN